jgi:peroxiredoxin
MTTVSQPPRDGLLLPAFDLPRAGGGRVRVRAYRGRRSLALVFTHRPDCSACREHLVGALNLYAAYAEEDAEVLAVVPAPERAADAMRRALSLPFPVAVDEAGTVFDRFGLTWGRDAAVMVTDRYGEPRLWSVAGEGHDLPSHDAIIEELRYLALICAGGCSVPLWQER